MAITISVLRKYIYRKLHFFKSWVFLLLLNYFKIHSLLVAFQFSPLRPLTNYYYELSCLFIPPQQNHILYFLFLLLWFKVSSIFKKNKSSYHFPTISFSEKDYKLIVLFSHLSKETNGKKGGEIPRDTSACDAVFGKA